MGLYFFSTRSTLGQVCWIFQGLCGPNAVWCRNPFHGLLWCLSQGSKRCRNYHRENRLRALGFIASSASQIAPTKADYCECDRVEAPVVWLFWSHWLPRPHHQQISVRLRPAEQATEAEGRIRGWIPSACFDWASQSPSFQGRDSGEWGAGLFHWEWFTTARCGAGSFSAMCRSPRCWWQDELDFFFIFPGFVELLP